MSGSVNKVDKLLIEGGGFPRFGILLDSKQFLKGTPFVAGYSAGSFGGRSNANIRCYNPQYNGVIFIKHLVAVAMFSRTTDYVLWTSSCLAAFMKLRTEGWVLCYRPQIIITNVKW